MNAIEKEYKEKTGGDLIPLYMVMGNSIFADKFEQSPELVYIYCIEHNRRGKKSLNGILSREWSIKNGGD